MDWCPRCSPGACGSWWGRGEERDCEGRGETMRQGLGAKPALPRAALQSAGALPVVGEGVEVWDLHRAGVWLVAELVNQQPLLSFPDHAHLEKEDL